MNERFQKLCRDYKIQTAIDPRLYDKYNVKRGLRNNDGSGVVVGLTNICCVPGYVIEETAYLLLFGNLPDKEHLEDFKKIVTHYRTLPPYFAEDVLMRCPSSNIMNKMAQSVLALYTYDKEPENKSMESEMLKAISVIARLPAIMVGAYQVMRRYLYNSSMVMHPINLDESLAESILSTLRDNREYTKEEAKLLDLCLMLHAEHGGGNNSTFTCRCVTSTGTKNWENEGEVADFLTKILNKEENDHSGLIYGMGHAVYTLSDPRAVQLKKSALKLAKGTEVEAEFRLLDTIERLTPQLFAKNKGDIKTMCANVDMYSGLVYKLLGIPVEMYTALFACARMPGWCAHRMEEIENGKRIMRPAYRTLIKNRDYIALDER